KILLAYDGSEHSRRALERAADYAKGGAELRVIEVVDVPAQTGGHAPEPTEARDVVEVTSQLKDAMDFLARAGVAAEAIKGYGKPADAIIEEAAGSGADLIIVGTHGRSAIGR